MKVKHQLRCLKHLVICEEKYKFTPDDFKAATRAQRKVTTSYSISHLITSEEVLSDDKFDKPSLVSFAEGKSIASTYLAKNIEALDIKENIIIDIEKWSLCVRVYTIIRREKNSILKTYARLSSPDIGDLNRI